MMKRFNEDDVIIREGEVYDEMYKIVSGRVAAYLNYGEENEYIVGILSEHQCFGEAGPLSSAPALYTVVALTDVLLLPYGNGDMDNFILENHTAVLQVMRNMVRTMNVMRKNIDLLMEELKYVEPPESKKFKALELKLERYKMFYDL